MTTEQEIFVEKVLNNWNTAYSSRQEQAQLIRILLNRVKALEEKKMISKIKQQGGKNEQR